MKKKFFYLVLSVLVATSTVPCFESYANTAVEFSQARADIIEWRYKIENNKLYRRQYNYSKQEWIGEWEFVGNVS